MGVKGTFRSANGGGGCPFLYALSISKGLPFAPCSCSKSVGFPAFIVSDFQTIGANFRQKGAKVNDFLGVLGVFSGKSETRKGKI